MSAGDSQSEFKRRIAEAIEDARDGPIDSARLESIRRLLLTNPEARRYYLKVNELNHHLASVSVSSAEYEFVALSAYSSRRSQRTPFITTNAVLACAVAALSLVVVVAVLMRDREPPTARPPVIGSLERINGEVHVTGADAETKTVTATTDIGSGATIRTLGTLSSAVLRYPDGTRLLLVGQSSLTVSDVSRKGVVFHSGTMFATVAPQAAGRPMLVTTPNFNVKVLGTRFSLGATADGTDLSVSEGRVVVTGLRDGRSVEVPAGKRVVSDEPSELALQRSREAPDSWNVDFENGLPRGWESGALVSDELPDGSRFAVKAVEGRDGSFAIVSQALWLRGAFSVHSDSFMLITFNMETPNWVNVFLITRTKDSADPHFANNFQYVIPFGRLQAGRWYSIAIPLSQFARLQGYTDEPLQDLLPFQIVFTSPAPNRGLVVDEIRIDRGAPEAVELKRID